MNKKYVTFIIFLMFMTFTFFPSVESAGINITLEDWNDYNLGVSSGTGTCVEWERQSGDDFEITNAVTINDGYCLALSTNAVDDTGWINLTTAQDYIGGVSFSIKINALAGTHNFLFYNNSVYQIRIKLNAVSHDIETYNIGTTNYVDIYDGTNLVTDATDGIYHINFTHISGNSMNYSVYNKNWVLLGSIITGTSNTDDWVTFEEIKITTDGLSEVYLDDIAIYSQIAISEDECEYRYMTERYDYIGNINSGCNRQSNKKTIETRYNIPVDMNITGVDLAISSDQYNDDSDLSDYSLTFNGLNPILPDCFIEYSFYYIIRWIIDVELTNEIPILEFTHSDKTSYGRYWQMVTGCYSSTDLDNDGEVNYKESTTADGTYNGQIWNWDIAYQMYYENIQFPDDETYYDNDYIHVINETHYCGEPVWLTYTLTSMASDTYLRIWNDDTSVEISDVTFPYLCPTTSETVGFVAETSSNYTAKLYRSSIELDNVSFFVNDFRNPTNYVYTMPNPCFEGESYLVKYAFNNADDYDGAIFLSDTPNYRNYFEIHYIFDGESGIYAQLINAPCTIYYIMAVDKNGTYYVTNNGIHQHTVKSRSMTNYFTLGAIHLTLQEGESTQSIYGETTHIGGNCKIYDNGKLVYTITKTPFSEVYTITTAGNHKVEMRLITNETTVLLTQYYNVSGISEDEQIEDTSYLLHNWVYDAYGDIGLFLAGVCVVLGFMFMPFALVLGVNVKYNKNIAIGDMHWSIYIIFAIVGVIVDVQLHLAELWIILLVCVVSIAITVLSWNSRR